MRGCEPCIQVGLYSGRRGPDGRVTRIASLEAQLSRAIFPKQSALPDIPADHLNGPMPGLVHDRPFRSASYGRTGRVTGSERMASKANRIEPSPQRQFLDNP